MIAKRISNKWDLNGMKEVTVLVKGGHKFRTDRRFSLFCFHLETPPCDTFPFLQTLLLTIPFWSFINTLQLNSNYLVIMDAGWPVEMMAQKRDQNPAISSLTEEPQFIRKTKFEVYGEEMIEKEVKQSGNSGRVYLPPEWIGKHVKIIRIE